jgi:uncharacterized repeat protein (TIGR03803 family)
MPLAIGAVALVHAPAHADNGGTGADTIVYAFDNANGQYPTAQLLLARDGYYYGTTQYGGAYSSGTFFRMAPSGKVSVLHSFIQDGVDGFQPVGNLMQDSAGNIYGTTSLGGSMYLGTIFRWSAAGIYSVVHSCQGAPNDCNQPYAPLVQANDGSLYGTSPFGGATDQGAAFRIDATGTLTLLHSFNQVDGVTPQWGLTLASDGNFYGSATQGGAYSGGALFRMTPSGAYTVLHDMMPAVDGVYPQRLIQGSDGRFYGTAAMGGPSTGGTVFSVTPDGQVTVLHWFTQGLADGDWPNGVIEGKDGFLYGTNANWGSDQMGTLFRLSKTGDFATLHKFAPGTASAPNDGMFPQAPPIVLANGVLMGTTAKGGIPGQFPAYGTIYTFGTAKK